MNSQNILIDNSGYHLKNLGDVAMLQAAVLRIRNILPDSKISIIASDEERLKALIPNTEFISHHWIAQTQQIRQFPIPHRLIPRRSLDTVFSWEQDHRIRHPESGLKKTKRAALTHSYTPNWFEFIEETSHVIATGGGFLTDAFRQHATGILTLLSWSQALGKPTAFFGQGIGPIKSTQFAKQAAFVLQKTHSIGLREDLSGQDWLTHHNCPPGIMTGDDALELLVSSSRNLSDSATPIVGLTFRQNAYAGTSADTKTLIKQLLNKLHESTNCTFCPLPIDQLDSDTSDEHTTLDLIADLPVASIFNSPKTPQDVIKMAGSCNLTLSGSYHAALFSLAQGVPVLGLQANDYYKGKFSGLEAIYPNGLKAFIINRDSPSVALEHSLDLLKLTRDIRSDWIECSMSLNQRGRELYQSFFKSQKSANS